MTPDSHSSFELLLREAAELPIPAASSTLLPESGTVLQAKYRIEEKLGEGGMGAVFRATHVETGKQVAIKWLLGKTPLAGQRFFREACLTARIDHPNVVNAFDYGAHQGGRYLVMELLRGESLGARIRRQRLSADELVEIMIPVLRGVAAAHRANVIHRDLKPDNVFLCVGPDGSARPPKVLDFGVSKLCGPLPFDEHLTGQGTGLGTVAYMSPEQLVDAPNVDKRTDIYAAGVMMYEALTGCRPFRAEGHNALVLRIEKQRPLPISSLVPDVPRALERIVLRAMAKEPDDRQPDVEVLIDELQGLNIDVQATGAGGGSHGPTPRMHWTWAVGFALPLSLAIWYAAHLPERAAPPRSVHASLASVPRQAAPAADDRRAPDPAILAAGDARATTPVLHDGAALPRRSRVIRPAAPLPPSTARPPVLQARARVKSPSGRIELSDL